MKSSMWIYQIKYNGTVGRVGKRPDWDEQKEIAGHHGQLQSAAQQKKEIKRVKLTLKESRAKVSGSKLADAVLW